MPSGIKKYIFSNFIHEHMKGAGLVMIKRKTDGFSKAVAFITAFAIAMLTVTLVHRTIISAEEALPDVSESYDASDTDGNGESVPADTVYDPAETEISEDINEFIPDNDIWEDFSNDFDITADDSGILTFADVNEGEITPGKTPVTADSIIKPTENKIKIYKAGNQEITPGEPVRDGDRLEFDFEWSIDDSDTTDYSNSYFVYDLTNALQGVTLTERTYSYWANEKVKAVYAIVNEKDSDGNIIKTLMYIEPREGFEEGSTNRVGSIHLEGEVNLKNFPAGNTNVTLKFLNAEANVTAPSLDNSIYPRKEAVGTPVKRGDKYYQQYKITLYNWTANDTDGNTVLDIPGDVLQGPPQNVYISYGDSGNKVSSTAAPNENGSGYTFTVGQIASNSQACIEYEMEVDAAAALDPSINYERLKNKASVDNDPNKTTTEATIDVSSIRPKVDKNGVLDKANNRIEWTITINSNGMGDKDFTVTDIIDSNLTIPGYNGSWTQKDFVDKGNGVWVKTYYTELPETVTNNQGFHNKAEVKYDGTDYVYSGEAYVTYTYDDVDVNKECTGLNGDKIGWTITIDVPDHIGSSVKSIVITDTENAGEAIYNGTKPYRQLLVYDTSQIKVQVEGNENKPANEKAEITYDWTNYQSGFILTIDDPAFLSLVSGKKVTISYETGIADGFDIDNVNLVHNDVSCTVEYEDDSIPGGDSAEYKNEKEAEPFVIEKNTTNATWYDPDGNIDNPGALREIIIWSVTLSSFTNLDTEKDNIITFTDKLPEGYTFNTTLAGKTYPDHYVSCYMSAGWPNEGPLYPDIKFNSDYTEITGTITLTGDQAKAIMANNGNIDIKYYTQMTESKYSEYLVKGETETFTNNVSATVNKDTRKADCSVDKNPGNKVLDKTSGEEFIEGQNVDYTIAVNSEAVHLGNESATVITLTDTLGKNLSFNNDLTITPRTGSETWSYDENKREITLKLKNDKAYTIKYTAKVVTRLTYMEHDWEDGVDDDARDHAIVDMLYGNTAVLSFPGGDDVTSHNLIGANIYRSNVYIRSELSNQNDANEVMYLRIKKQWDDTDNPKADENGKVYHDETVRIKLMKYYEGGTEPINTNAIELDLYHYNNEAGDYDGRDYYKIIKELPIKDKDGNRYTYKIVGEEDLPENYVYKASSMTKATGNDVITGISVDTYVITITNTYDDDTDRTKITVKKAWQGENGNTQNRGDSINFTITQDGEPYVTGTLTAKDGWKEKSFNLPKYNEDENKDYVYGVIETTKNPYYKAAVTSVTDSNGKGTTFTITNNYLDQAEIKVIKEWKNDTNYTDLRSDSVSFTVKQNGVDFKTGKLNSTNSWTQTIKVPKYSDINKTKLYEYSVEENTNNPYYKTVIAPAKGTGGSSFTITNTLRERIKITVEKVWEGDTDHEDLRSDYVDFSIIRSGRLYRIGELNNTDGWTQTFDLLKYFDLAETIECDYSVEENTDNRNYSSRVVEGTPNAKGDKTIKIINTFDPTDITITKKWDDAGNEDNRTDVKVILRQNGDLYGKYTISGSNNDDEWSYTVTGVPKYDKDGKPYTYTIEEESIPDNYKLTEVVDPDETNDYKASLTNKYKTETIDLTEEIKINVTKRWIDEGQVDNRTDVVFDLIRNKGKDDEFVKTYTISKEGKTGDSWRYTISDLKKYDDEGIPYTYTIEEKAINSYTSKVTQNPTEGNLYNAVIRNEYKVPETISISVTKNWDDDGYKYKRGDVTLKLMQKSDSVAENEYASYTLSAEANTKNEVWTYTFRGVPKYDNDGNEYTYTIDEEPIDGYTSTVTKNPTTENSWSITNKYDVPPDPNDPNEPEPNEPNEPKDPDPNEPNEPDPNEPNKPNEPEPGTRPSYPPSGTSPSSTTVTEPKEPSPPEEPEDVSAEAGFFDEEFDAVRRDDMMIIILAGIIITGTLTLAFRHRSDKSDGKYHM